MLDAGTRSIGVMEWWSENTSEVREPQDSGTHALHGTDQKNIFSGAVVVIEP